ncbi:MAG TPA: hypothetical protein VJN18_20195 [Polyangiaceae bacterium]|nr:hypothetical protein [Polyangiaceae bacterium]
MAKSEHDDESVWCLLDQSGEAAERGKMSTTGPELQRLVRRLGETEPVLVGQEVGKLAFPVHE